MSNKPTLLILGKLPPPWFGPAIATQILLNSALRDDFHLAHVNTAINSSIATMGKGSARKIWRNLGIYRRMWKMMRQERPDFVLIPISQTTTGFLKDAVFIWIASLFRNRILLHLRGSDFRNWQQRSGSITRFITGATCRRADGVIVLGESLRYLFEGYFGQDEIHVVPNGANYTVPTIAREEGRVRLLYLANMLESKGIRDVVEAMVMLKTSGHTISLDVAGTWGSETLREYCEALVRKEDLAVRFHSPVDGEEKLRMMAASDIFLFPPREPEGHPWVLVEAMACGLPIISTDKGAIKESVIEGENGFLVESHSPGSIAECVLDLVQDTELRIRMGRRSRELYEAKFTEEKMIKALKKALSGPSV